MIRRMIKQLTPYQRIHIQIWISFVVVLCVMLMVTWYGRLQTVPTGVSLSGWKPGNISLSQFVEELEQAVELLKQQQIEISTAVPNSAPPLIVTAGELGLHSNVDNILEEFEALREGSILMRASHRWFMRGKSFTLELGLDEEHIERLVHHHWEALQNRQPINAQRSIDPYDQVHLEPDQPAFRIDTDRLLHELDQLMYTNFYAWKDKKLLDSSKSLSVELPLRMVPADVTIEQLAAERVERKIIEFSTRISPSSSEGRRFNIDSTAQVLNTTLLAPGEIFDYSTIVERTRTEIGYKPAPVIMNGQFVPGIGGGICQVSTTLYNAVIRIGLEVVERRNHSLPISYAPLGQDATYATGAINFRFRNTLDSYLLIHSEVKDHVLTVKLFGAMDPTLRYTIESKIVKQLPPPVQYVHNGTLAKGEQHTIQQGKSGYVVETYRTKWLDGKEQERELLTTDRYEPKPTLIARNQDGSTTSESTSQHSVRAPLIEDGIYGPTF